MKAGGKVRGVPLTMVKAIRITTPTPYAIKTSKKKDEKDAACSEEEGDSCEEAGKKEMSSDMEGEAIDVDTDSDKKSFDESGNSLSEASISSDDGPAKGGPGPATGPASSGPADGIAHDGRSGPRIWSNGYFYIKGNEYDLKMFIHEEFTAAAEIGDQFRSKTITPGTIGETRDSPTKTMLSLTPWGWGFGRGKL